MIRAPNHLGDLVMALPALVPEGSDVMVVRQLAPVLAMAGLGGRVLRLDRGSRGFGRAVLRLRRGGYRRGVLLSGSFSAAWALSLRGRRRATRYPQRREGLVAARGDRSGGATRTPESGGFQAPGRWCGPGRGAAPLLSPPTDRASMWRARLGRDGRSSWPAPLIAIVPGANAHARRWPSDRFAELARWGVRSGIRGGPRKHTRESSDCAGSGFYPGRPGSRGTNGPGGPRRDPLALRPCHHERHRFDAPGGCGGDAGRSACGARRTPAKYARRGRRTHR